ncbi:MAG: DNA translocase FtsK [Verrucomicrobia bacterium]|nr:DNA translocase FtsK [Verrucomicrobiota bacterium]
MARKDSAKTPSQHGSNDIVAIILIATALIIALALFSYNANDVSANTAVPNSPRQNWIGPFGAWIGYGLFFIFGAGAFLLPVLLLLFGMAYFLEFWSYLRTRWLSASLLFISCLALLGFHSSWFPTLNANLNALGAGGLIGHLANQYIAGLLGKAGATIAFLTVYAVSLLFLTNFQLGTWVRALWSPEGFFKKSSGTDEEKELERRARELEKQAKKLQENIGTSPKPKKESIFAATEPEEIKPSGLGADGKPVPEPMIRDLSVASSIDRQKKPAEPEPAPVQGIAPGEEIMVIPAREVAAATSADILGQVMRKNQINGEEDDTAKVAGNGSDISSVGEGEDEMAIAAAAAPLAPSRPKYMPKKPKRISVASTPQIGNYRLPTMDFLQFPDTTLKPTESKEELMANAQLMKNTLGQFGIEVAVGDITKGPTITRYELHPAPGVRLEKIAALSNNIAAALRAERINILAPVPGKSSVGVEVPNKVKTKVIMRDLLESPEWQKSKARIPLALGKDVYGHPIIADLAEMPHLLIAGSTGSGKSVCINSIIASLLYRFPPDQLRFVMIDPKVVELQQYNALPHLVVPVVTDPKKVILALRWVVNEMEKRYQIFARVGVRNIKSFNERPKNKPTPPAEPELPLMSKKEKIEAGQDGFAVELDEEIVVPRDDDIVIPDKLSYIVVIIDELADLMLVAPADVEMAIARITQMARAAGIHCIVATQRPSVDVITGVIKANIPARIAFQVAAKVDSRTILDAMGADKLLGKGDMLYLPPGSARLIRAQGVLITDEEIQQCVDFIAQQGKPSYEMEIHKQLQKPAASLDVSESGCGEDEAIIEQCVEVIRTEQKASVSLLQRRLRLGYGRAARIMDELEDRGIVGPSKGAEPRDILIDLDGGGADGREPIMG